jgi:acetyltransferase
MTAIRQVVESDQRLVAELVALLTDSVHGGASVGFLAPLPPATAERYWADVFASLGPGHSLFVAEDGERVVGSVQIDFCQKDNGRHRAEVQKLAVLSSCRGQGIASQLMRTLEEHAKQRGCTLLVLDTHAGSHAETVYRHHGWQCAGEIPDYAGLPSGELIATALYFKRLVAS